MTTDAIQPLPGRRPVYAEDADEQPLSGADRPPVGAPRQQPHSEPLDVPGNARVDSAPDADDPDLEPDRA